MSRNLWTREELIVTLALYFQLPFGRLNQGTREVIELANLIGRTKGSVALRLCNFAACDPYILGSGRTGMPGGVPICKPIWEEYEHDKEKLFFDAHIILAKLQENSMDSILEMPTEDYTGKERESITRQRVNQYAFRSMILNNYDYKCAITGLDVQSLLIASHIIPWADNVEQRLNPENGICLSPLYDKAFDNGLISILPDYEIVVSRELKEHSKEDFYQDTFGVIEHRHIILPEEHKPNPLFLQYHYDNIFAPHD